MNKERPTKEQIKEDVKKLIAATMEIIEPQTKTEKEWIEYFRSDEFQQALTNKMWGPRK